MRHSEEQQRRIPHDRATGMPARGDGRIEDGTRSDEIEQEIRRTRARMGATLDEIEGRLAPARIKRQLKSAVDDTIAEVRNEYHPRRMAQHAGDTMLDTIKHHPLAALAAGLSVGYLAMKGAEESGTNGYGEYDPDDYGRTGYTGSEYGRTAYGRTDYRPTARAYEEHRERAGSAGERMRERSGETGAAYRDGAEDLRGRAEQAGERIREESREVGEAYRHGANELREQAEEATRATTQRARELTHSAERRSRETARSARRKARSAGSRIEDFIYDNPLAAGAVAVGVGALLGGLFPSTDVENRTMGPARDEAFDRARSVANETVEEGKQAARRVRDEARDAAKDVADKGRQEAKNVGESAKQSATREAESAQHSGDGEQRARQTSERGGSDPFKPTNL